jgi:1-acyl-sn-glycerol-3-phosphate acyltransferase
MKADSSSPAGLAAPPQEKLPPGLPGDYWYKFVRVLFKVFFRLLGDLRTGGTENIPRSGPVLFAANHNSHLDPPLVGTDIERTTWFMAKEELFDHRLFRIFMIYMHGFPVKRHTADRAAIRKALMLLRCGETVTVFPEGERSRDGNLKPAEAGVGLIALRSRATVIPVAIRGTREALPPGGLTLKPHPIRVEYGPPVDLSDLHGRRETRDTLQEAADRIMAAIADLLGVPAPERDANEAKPSPAVLS